MFKPSGNPRVKEITETWKERSYQLSRLKVIKLPELSSKGKPKRLCVWCNEKEVYGNQKYCSQICLNSAMAWCYPQKEDGLRFLLIRQEFKCLHCQFDYLPILREVMEKDRLRYEPKEFNPDIISWFYFKRLKQRCPKERIPEIDHVLPIFKGGTSLGIFNHQLLCYQCHKVKTAKDLSGKRKGKEK